VLPHPLCVVSTGLGDPEESKAAHIHLLKLVLPCMLFQCPCLNRGVVKGDPKEAKVALKMIRMDIDCRG
jgi:hypothetical protein